MTLHSPSEPEERPDHALVCTEMAQRNSAVERNAGMMIELDQHDGAMDPVVEGTIIGYRAHPAK